MSDYSKNMARELILGDFHEGPRTLSGGVGNVIIGFIPIVGQAADLRDTVAAIKEVTKNHKSATAWAGLGLALVFWIPGTDLLKVTKVARTGKKVSFGKKVMRTFWEDRKTFGASRDFFKRHRWLFGKGHGWSMEHSLLKQRFYRSTADPENWHPIMKMFPPGTTVNKILQKLGDAGWNQVPIPKSLNQWLYRNSAISALFNVGSYAAAGSFVYGAIQLGTHIEEKFSGWLLQGEEPEEADQKPFTKKITLD